MTLKERDNYICFICCTSPSVCYTYQLSMLFIICGIGQYSSCTPIQPAFQWINENFIWLDFFYGSDVEILRMLMSSWSWSYGSWISTIMQSVPITTKVNSNPVHGEVYSIQRYVIKLVSDLWQFGAFLWVLWFLPSIKTDSHDISEI